MLLSDFIEARREKRIAAAREAVKAEGMTEVYRKIAAWDRRRREAEARAWSSQNPRQHNRRRIQKNNGITEGRQSKLATRNF